MNPSQAKEYLNSFINYEFVTDSKPDLCFDLRRIHRVLKLLSDPQKGIKFIHVAGTKGKGSTCAFVAYILKEAGYSVGLYTSPHLNDFKERIRCLDPKIDTEDPFGGSISDEDFCFLLEKIKPALEEVLSDKQFSGLSYFEVLTVLAIYYFHECSVDFAVLETGLGGRLDATNAVDSAVCAIMPIGLEHSKQLGSTLAAIAKEKAAIIKNPNQIAVIAPQNKEAFKEIDKRCQEIGVRSLVVDKDIYWEGKGQNTKEQIFDVRGTLQEYLHLKTRLLGRHQVINAAVAVGIIESLKQLGCDVDAEAIYRGIEETYWPGRFEIIRENPFIVLDSAHTTESCRALAKTMRAIFPGRKIILLAGISEDKDIKGICSELKKLTESVILTKSTHPRAHWFVPEEAQTLFGGCGLQITGNVEDAIKEVCKKANPEDIILITGSIFVVGEARDICLRQILMTP